MAAGSLTAAKDERGNMGLGAGGTPGPHAAMEAGRDRIGEDQERVRVWAL